MGIWEKMFGTKYLSWEEYQEKMFQLEEELWHKQAATQPPRKLDLPHLKR